jgi:hypothetical protein
LNNSLEEINEDVLSNKKKDSIPNMSIFKFMVDNQYFINSNIELENMSLIQGKIIKPDFSFSDISQNGAKDSSKRILEIKTEEINSEKKVEKDIKNLETNFNTINNAKKKEINFEEKKEEENNKNEKEINGGLNDNISFAEQIEFKDDKLDDNNGIDINKIIKKNDAKTNICEDINNSNEIKNKNIKELILNLRGTKNKNNNIKSDKVIKKKSFK